MNPKAEKDYVREHGIKVYSTKDVARMGPVQVAQKAVRQASEGTDGVYVCDLPGIQGDVSHNEMDAL